MSSDDDNPPDDNNPPNDDNTPEDDVGYGRPPASKRWRKGVSGNPRGRPRKPRGGIPHSPDPMMHLTVIEEANRLVKIKQEGKITAVPIITAVIRGLGIAAAGGDRRAQLAFADLYVNAEKQRLKDKVSQVESASAYKQRWEAEIVRCDEVGRTRPEPIPHPADIVIDYSSGNIIWNGPRDPAEAAQWEAARRKFEAMDEVLGELYEERSNRPGQQEEIDAQISAQEKAMENLDQMYPSERQRRRAGFRLDVWRTKGMRSD